MLDRPRYSALVNRRLQVFPAVSILGPRQVGKTTLARLIAANTPSQFFDLEDPVSLRALGEPATVLGRLSGLVVIDEVQRKPELFEVLRVLIDRPGRPATFLLLGSASPSLVQGVSETLAGRTGFVDLAGFDLSEVGTELLSRLWLRGGYPRSFLAPDDSLSLDWRRGFLRSFVERDVPALGFSIPSTALLRFWQMLSHYHGNLINYAELARSLDLSESTARRYVDLLQGTYMVRLLQPWYQNVGKRQVKSPKVYVRDSGLLHALLELPDMASIERNPKLGASWEGFALEQVLALAVDWERYFWATQGGAELDLLLVRGERKIGFEFKWSDAPSTTKSMHTAMRDLGLEKLWVVYPGSDRYILHEKIEAVPLAQTETVLAETL
jgi:predicted AAA+ superfamily ATPase